METETLWSLCNQHKWFTCGTNTQFDKLFELSREGATFEELALIIWVCSSNVSRAEIDRILRAAEPEPGDGHSADQAEADVCARSDFDEQELNTGTCKHECYCTFKGPCPMRKINEKDEQLYADVAMLTDRLIFAAAPPEDMKQHFEQEYMNQLLSGDCEGLIQWLELEGLTDLLAEVKLYAK